MIIVIKVLLFLFGMALAVQLIAALFGFIDCRYCLGSEFFRISRRVVFWSLIILGIARLLPQGYSAAFLWGLPAEAAVYFCTFLAFKIFFRPPRGPDHYGVV